ncbi:MAG: tetratricopeptide repeat protein [Treponematales bacterium]
MENTQRQNGSAYSPELTTTSSGFSDAPPSKGEYEKLWDKLTHDVGLSAMFWLFLGAILLIFSSGDGWQFDIPGWDYTLAYRAWLGILCFVAAGVCLWRSQTKTQRAAKLNKAGTAWYNKKKYNRAIKKFDKALKTEPDYTEAYCNRGNAHYSKGEYDKAITDYTAALKIKPDYLNALYNRGTAYAIKGEYEVAIEDYTAALKIKPKFPEALNNRGAAYDDKGEYGKAIADFNKALTIKPDKCEALNNRGLAYAHNGEYDKAIADYNAALAIKPDYALAKANLAKARAAKAAQDAGGQE